MSDEKRPIAPEQAAVQAAGAPALTDRFFYAVILGAVSVFFIVTYPYRDISFPSPFLAAMGLGILIVLSLASWARPSYYWASIGFCVYIPFSGEYPGDFGRMLLGINFTNLLLIPLILQWLMHRGHHHQPLFRFHAPDLPLLCFCILSSVSLMRGAV